MYTDSCITESPFFQVTLTLCWSWSYSLPLPSTAVPSTCQPSLSSMTLYHLIVRSKSLISASVYPMLFSALAKAPLSGYSLIICAISSLLFVSIAAEEIFPLPTLTYFFEESLFKSFGFFSFRLSR